MKDTRSHCVMSNSLQPLPNSSVHGILQAIILEWVALPFSRGSSQSRDQTQVSHIADRFFTVWATKEAMSLSSGLFNNYQGNCYFQKDDLACKMLVMHLIIRIIIRQKILSCLLYLNFYQELCSITINQFKKTNLLHDWLFTT